MDKHDIEHFVERAKSVLRRIARYEQSEDQEIPRHDLEFAKREIESMIANTHAGTLPLEDARCYTLSRMILDQWPLGHELGRAISELEEEYVRRLR